MKNCCHNAASFFDSFFSAFLFITTENLFHMNNVRNTGYGLFITIIICYYQKSHEKTISIACAVKDWYDV